MIQDRFLKGTLSTESRTEQERQKSLLSPIHLPVGTAQDIFVKPPTMLKVCARPQELAAIHKLYTWAGTESPWKKRPRITSPKKSERSSSSGIQEKRSRHPSTRNTLPTPRSAQAPESLRPPENT